MKSNEILYSPGGNDECFTPAYGVTPILEFLAYKWNPVVWCPFDQEHSQFVQVLQKAGHKVVHSHILDGQDFYYYEPEEWDIMISNPPFTNKRKIFERAISFNKPFALLMSNTWLNDAAPKQLFQKIGLQLLMFDKRIEYEGLPEEKRKKITFSSSYFCRDFLPTRLEIREIDK